MINVKYYFDVYVLTRNRHICVVDLAAWENIHVIDKLFR